MTTLVITVIAMIGFTLFLILFFRANAGIMFLATCAGLVLLSSLDPGVVTAAGAVVPGEGEAYVRLSVVVLSAVFAALMFRNSVHGSKLLYHGFIGVLMACVLWLLLPEITGVSWLVDLTRDSAWQDVNEFRSLIIAAGFSLSLLAIFVDRQKHHKKSKH